MTPFPAPPDPSEPPDPEEEIRPLVEANRQWAEARSAEDPDTFPALARSHRPPFLLVGCCDARVPLDLITGASPGHLFIHRNVGNQVQAEDPAIQASVEFALGALGVRHLIVCGHTGCGAMQAAFTEKVSPAVARWVEPVRALRKEVEAELMGAATLPERADLLSERNVIRQMQNLLALEPVRQAAADPKRTLSLHGWLFRLDSGLIENLPLPLDRWRREGRWPD